MAQARGLIVLTDSDGAGFVIRNFIKSCIDPALVKHAYIPDIKGKERRKKRFKGGQARRRGYAAGLLLDALIKCGATIDDLPPLARTAHKQGGHVCKKA